MKSNNIFNYVIYALLGVLFLSVGYYALEKRKEQAQKEEEMRRDREQLEKSLADMNTVGDSTEAGQSAYVGESAAGTKTKASKDGIEDEANTSKTATAQPATAAATKPATAATAPATTKPATATKTVTAPPVADAKKLVAKSGTATTSKQSVAPANNGRYLVVVGAFGQIENARTEMEKYVKMGYQDAEVVKYTSALWRVVAKRCSKRSDAEKYELDLEKRGADAMIVDSAKK